MRVISVIFLLIISITLFGQEIKVVKTIQLKAPGDNISFISAVAPDGEHLLVSGGNYKGLKILSIKSGELREVSDAAGAGFEPCFSGDGRYIYFRKDEFISMRKVSSLMRYDLSTGKSELIADKVADLSSPTVSGHQLHYVAGDRMHSAETGSIETKGSDSEAFILLDDLTPVLYYGGERRLLKPGGEGSYIWVSLSPDRSKVLCYMAGRGALISDLEGNLLFEAGRISSPKWLNNKFVIGMEDTDDGYRVTGSEIVCFSLATSKRIVITSTPDLAEMYPLPLPDGKIVVFQTPEGALYKIKLRFR